MNYSEGGGWGANVGVTLGQGDAGVMLGVNYSEAAGFGAFGGISAINNHGQTASLGVGYNKLEGFGGNVGVGQGAGILQLTYSELAGLGAGFQISHDVHADNTLGGTGGQLTLSMSTTQNAGSSAGVSYSQTHESSEKPVLDANGDPVNSALPTWSTATLSLGATYHTEQGLSANLGANSGSGGFNFSLNEFTGVAGNLNLGEQPNFIESHEQLTSAMAGMMQQQRAQFEYEKYVIKEAEYMATTFAADGLTPEMWFAMAEGERNDWREKNKERIRDAINDGRAGELSDAELAGVKQSQDGWGDVLAGLFTEGFGGLFTNTVYNSNAFIDEDGNFAARTCFTKGTLVRAEDGHRGVETIRPGDRVLTYNEATGRLEWKRVTKTYVRQTDRIYHVYYENDTHIETTATHPFYIVGLGWTEARTLRSGDVSKTSTGSLSIARIVVEARYETVYNFSVEDNHNYFVTNDEVLVHNSENYEFAKAIAVQFKAGQMSERDYYAYFTVLQAIMTEKESLAFSAALANDQDMPLAARAWALADLIIRNDGHDVIIERVGDDFRVDRQEIDRSVGTTAAGVGTGFVMRIGGSVIGIPGEWVGVMSGEFFKDGHENAIALTTEDVLGSLLGSDAYDASTLNAGMELADRFLAAAAAGGAAAGASRVGLDSSSRGTVTGSTRTGATTAREESALATRQRQQAAEQAARQEKYGQPANAEVAQQAQMQQAVAHQWTKRARIKHARLPSSGKIRYIPPRNYHPGQPLPRGPQGGYMDRYGNEWVRGPSRTPGQAFEWDVQLGQHATPGMKKFSPDGRHVNVSLDGEVTH